MHGLEHALYEASRSAGMIKTSLPALKASTRRARCYGIKVSEGGHIEGIGDDEPWKLTGVSANQ